MKKSKNRSYKAFYSAPESILEMAIKIEEILKIEREGYFETFEYKIERAIKPYCERLLYEFDTRAKLFIELKRLGTLPDYIGSLDWVKLISKSFENKDLPFERIGKKKPNPKPSFEFTPLEKKLYRFCKKHKIDITKSPDIIEVKAIDKGFRNLKGKKLLNRSTVAKMKDKIKKNPSLHIDF